MRGFPPAFWLIAAGIYVVCPLDLDFIPFVGWLDDILVAYLGYQKYQEASRLHGR